MTAPFRSGSTVLASVPQKGFAWLGPTGGISVTYQLVTLHFRPEGLRHFVAVLHQRRRSRCASAMEFRCGLVTLRFAAEEIRVEAPVGGDAAATRCATLRFTADECREFTVLVTAAWRRLRQLTG